MTIAITTPKGTVGAHTLRALVRAGERPRVLVRHPATLPTDVRPFVDAVATDLQDPASVAAATVGVDTLSWVTPSSAADDADPLAGYERFTDALIETVRANGISRVVHQSTVGAEIRHGAGELDALAAAEVRLDALGVDVVHLRCGYFMSNLLFDRDGLRSGVLRVTVPLDVPQAWVAPRDIGEVTAGRLLSRSWSERVVQAVQGPADLTWEQVAAVLSDVLGRRIVAEQIPDDVRRDELRAAGMTERQVESVLGMSIGLRSGFVPEQPRDALSTTPTTLREWAAEALADLRA